MGKVETGEQLTEQVNQSIADLESQLAAGHTQGYLDTLSFYSKFWKYSFGNSVLIAAQCPTATLVNGYRKWQELGFNVRKGESGIAIRAPWLRKEIDQSTGEKTERLIGYIATYVFDISQTAEYPAKQPPTMFQELPGSFDELYAHLSGCIQATGLTFEERPLQIGLHGFYENGRVVINANLSAYLKVTCLIHEYVHAIAHPDAETKEQWTRDEREWQAESVCYTVCRAIGIENVNSRDYLLSYRMTTEQLGEMIKIIQALTKRVLTDLVLLQPVKESVVAMAAD